MDRDRAERLYQGRPDGTLRAVHAMVDYAYLYLRLDVPAGPVDWSQRQYWFLLNTVPGATGTRAIPDVGMRTDTGANFLLQFTGPEVARLAIAANYNPNQRTEAVPGESNINRRRGFDATIADAVPFEDIVIEANRPRFTRDGTLFPSVDFNRSRLHAGTADRANPAFSDRATWHFEPASGMLEVRIPWALIYVTDPSSRRALAGTDPEAVPLARETPGISIAVLAVAAAGNAREVVESLPARRNAGFETTPRVYAWTPWNSVDAKPYFKPSYYALASLFAELQKRTP